MRTLTNKNCKYCEKKLTGRIDKKFCDKYCRSAFHNDRAREDLFKVRFINTQLKRNRDILHQLINLGKTKITKNALTARGFQFKFHTHIEPHPSYESTFYCYEVGYVEEKGAIYLIPELMEVTATE